MKKELLNLTGKIDTETVSTLRAIAEVTFEQNLPYIVVGATARDLVLHYGYGMPIQRATRDIDFAVEVASWGAFEKIRVALVEKGFTENGEVQHRLYSAKGGPIDIVPFGGVENHNSSIAWPPHDNPVMDVRGFKEVSENAQEIIICDEPHLKTRVVTPEGLMLLKLISWTDRAPELRKKDADDIWYILTNYYQIKNVSEDIHDDVHSSELEKYDWNPELGACSLLGKECRKIAATEITSEILKLRETKNEKNIERIVDEMQNTNSDKNLSLLNAFMSGFDL